MKVVAIVQARMGSSRLPGKVLKPILGIPMLQHMMQRLERASQLNEIVIATTDQFQDRVLLDFAVKHRYPFGIGPEHDVLMRYYKVAKERDADHIVRLTSDCPLIDPAVTDLIVKTHLASLQNDLTSNVFTRSYPRGLDTEVLSIDCLERVLRATEDPIYREHVTNYIHDYPEKFRIENVSQAQDESLLRWCVDTEEDLAFVTRIYEALYPQNPFFGYAEIREYLVRHPDVIALNEAVVQTKVFLRKNRA